MCNILVLNPMGHCLNTNIFTVVYFSPPSYSFLKHRFQNYWHHYDYYYYYYLMKTLLERIFYSTRTCRTS